MRATREQHLDPNRTPKRILALDGGGIRGRLTLEYLDAIEKLLKARSGQDLVLADYFDLIGGTSTGAIIAAALACGKSVADLKTLYQALGTGVFEKQFLKNGVLAAKYPAAKVRAVLDDNLGADTMLGGDRLKTGLLVMAKRLDTGSPWPLHNNPNARYAAQDGKLLLSQVVRASTAAPTYFAPEVIKIEARDGTAIEGAFVDGGVSPFNDPALQLLMVAALQGHGFRWQTGKDKLLLISVGTGAYRDPESTDAIKKMLAAEQGIRSLQSLMDDCARVNRTLLQWLTDCKTPWTMDRAVGDMAADSAAGPALATYARYDVNLDSAWLKAQLNVDMTAAQLAQVAKMDDPSNIPELSTLGAKGAAAQVKAEHFPPSFDV